jgi:hypothetical protein
MTTMTRGLWWVTVAALIWLGDCRREGGGSAVGGAAAVRGRGPARS